MQRSPAPFPLTNYIVFIVLSIAILAGYQYLTSKQHPRPKPAPVAKADKEQDKDKGQNQAKDKEKAKSPADSKKQLEAKAPVKEELAAKSAPANKKKELPAKKAAEQVVSKPAVAAAAKEPRRWVTLGSADEKSPYRMLVTLGNRGAALARIELSSPRYHDLDDRSGYLGHLVMEDDGLRDGCPVQVVGDGTPAKAAGLQVGDLIVAFQGTRVKTLPTWNTCC